MESECWTPQSSDTTDNDSDNHSKESSTATTTKPRRKYASYGVEFKLDVLRYNENHSQSVTAAKFGIDPKRIREWKKQKSMLIAVMASAELEDDQNYRIQSGKESNAKQGDLQNGGLDGTEMCIKQELVDDDGIVITDEEDSEDCAEWDEDDDDDEDLPGVVVPQLGGGNGVKRLKNQFTLKQKLEAMRYLETHSVNATSRFFGVATKSIREWRKKKDIIERLVREELLAAEQGNADEDNPTPRKRIPGAGRKKRPKEPEKDENPNKRQRRSLDVNEKVEIIRLIENGMTQSDVARQLRFSQSTVQTIWSNKNHILARYSTPKKKWKNLHWKRYADINDSLLEWYKKCKESNVPVDSKLIHDKALELADYYKKPEFKSQADRWVDIFQKRHGISDFEGKYDKHANKSGSIDQFFNPNLNLASLPNSLSYHPPSFNHNRSNQNVANSNPNFTSVPNNQSHDLIPDFDMTSLPASIMHGLYPPTDTPNSSVGIVTSGASQLPTPTNYNSHLTPSISSIQSVTTCDAMKYVELIRSWTHSTFGETGTSAETLNNHLNAIENLILKRRMTEMQDPSNNNASSSTQR